MLDQLITRHSKIALIFSLVIIFTTPNVFSQTSEERDITAHTKKTMDVSPETIFKTAEEVVNEQLDAYNSRDIDAFMETYSDDIILYQQTGEVMSANAKLMRTSYESFFKNTPDLHCKVVTRILRGNYVIDHEKVIMNGETVKAVAIYHVKDGKINKVWFLR